MLMCSSIQDGQSSLMFASENAHIEVVRMLISAGAKVDLQGEVSITSTSQGPNGDLCPDVMLYCGQEEYVHTVVLEIM